MYILHNFAFMFMDLYPWNDKVCCVFVGGVINVVISV